MTAQNNSGYKKITAYKKAKKLTINLYSFLNKKNITPTQRFLVSQLLGSASSVGANIAEGYGRYSDKSYKHFLSISRGSCFETEYWLEILIKIFPDDKEEIKKLIDLNKEIIKLLTTMLKRMS